MQVDPVTYVIEIDSKQACSFTAETMGSLWFDKLTMQCEPPAHVPDGEKPSHVGEFLKRLEAVPYLNLAGGEEKAEQAGKELQRVAEGLSTVVVGEGTVHDGLFFVHDGLISIKITAIR